MVDEKSDCPDGFKLGSQSDVEIMVEFLRWPLLVVKINNHLLELVVEKLL